MPGTPLSKLRKQTSDETDDTKDEGNVPNDAERQAERRPLLQGHASSPFGTAYASVNFC